MPFTHPVVGRLLLGWGGFFLYIYIYIYWEHCNEIIVHKLIWSRKSWDMLTNLEYFVIKERWVLWTITITQWQTFSPLFIAHISYREHKCTERKLSTACQRIQASNAFECGYESNLCYESVSPTLWKIMKLAEMFENGKSRFIHQPIRDAFESISALYKLQSGT